MKKISLVILLSISAIFSYSRKNWPHWSSTEYKCRNTRQQVLVERSLVPVTFKTSKRCKVTSGKWISYFTGAVITNPRSIDIDHTVPLGYVANRGGSKWPRYIKQRYANFRGNTYHLVIVEASLNRQKGKKPPYQWMPSKNRCNYVSKFLLIMNQWGIHLKADENKKFEHLLDRECK